ncbi:enoyl-CoA hydratase-related protein, partial [Klebsiella pneumoniae]|nr:enoyl-CoA hydratase-related protein [Klebsiella pneumoniae]
QVQTELAAAADEATRRDDIKAVVVYGGPKVLAAGADIKEMNDMTYAEMSKVAGRLQSALGSISEIPKPTVAAITGYALGGGLEVA